MTTPVHMLTVEVNTTNATPAALWDDPDTEDRSYEIFITAAEQTGSFANFRIFAKRFIRYTNSETTVLGQEVDIHADAGTAGFSATTATVQLDGSDGTEIRVVGLAATNITWRAVIRYQKIRP